MTLKSITAVCVDDDPAMLRALTRILEGIDADLSVVTLESGDAALKFIQSTPTEIMFVDWHMPGMDGMTLLDSLKQVSPNTEVVMITADGDPANVVAAMKAGATDYLTKPIEPQRLSTVTINLIQKWRMAEENRQLWQMLQKSRKQALTDSAIRVLIVEDNEYDAMAIRRYLEEDTGSNYEIEVVSTGKAVVTAYVHFHPDCILLDCKLSDVSSLDIIPRLADDYGRIDAAIVMLAGHGDEETAAMAMKAGAADFLLKPQLSSELLHYSVFGALEKMDIVRKARKQEDITNRVIRELEDTRNTLTYEAMHDPLTGILNRRGMMKQIRKVLRDPENLANPVTIAMCDIDYFKQVNDTYGHMAGDEVLAGVADRLKAGLRKGDLIGRFGGEEFILMVRQSGQGGDPFERLRATVADNPFVHGGIPINVTISLGVAESVHNLDIALAMADAALYAAKSKGRNQVVFNSPSRPPRDRILDQHP